MFHFSFTCKSVFNVIAFIGDIFFKKMSTQQLIPEEYCSYFHSNICHVCKCTESLKRCAKCKSIAYCSKEHQKIDWLIHKQFCLAMTKVNADCQSIAVTNFDDFLTVKKMKYRLLVGLLKRELLNYENQIWMFPRFCEICYSDNVNVECEKCRSVFFCSEDHKSKFKAQHSKHCDMFILNLQIGLYPIFNNINHVNIAVCDISKSIQTLPPTLKDLALFYDKNFSTKMEDVMQKIRTLNCLSPVATILYGLEQSGLIVNRKTQKNELTIHIVGGSMYEIGRLWTHMAELIFHFVENVTRIDFIIVGPELNYNRSTDKFTYHLCKSCKKKKCKTTCSFHAYLYHDIVTQLKEPDAVVAYNSGIHGNEVQNFLSRNENIPEYLWKDSIEYLVNIPNTPLILTAYILEELERDIIEVKKYAKSDVKILVEPHRNPFSDGKPLKNFESQLEPVFYINGFMAVLTRI